MTFAALQGQLMYGTCAGVSSICVLWVQTYLIDYTTRNICDAREVHRSLQ